VLSSVFGVWTIKCQAEKFYVFRRKKKVLIVEEVEVIAVKTRYTDLLLVLTWLLALPCPFLVKMTTEMPALSSRSCH